MQTKVQYAEYGQLLNIFYFLGKVRHFMLLMNESKIVDL